MKTLRTTLLASALILPLAAPAAWAETPPDILVVAQNIDDIVAIDPAQAYEFTSGELVTNIYDRLVQYDAEVPATLAPGPRHRMDRRRGRQDHHLSRCATA
jgi:peptide/nickel transport system substrate-binding protein